ncbi:MAG: hypothetical protein J5982_04950 [Bacilli bacterium]|nr:hypothetical protein [Bacilli bacterium]
MKIKVYKAPFIENITSRELSNDKLGVFESFVEGLKDSSFNLSTFYNNSKTVKYIEDNNIDKGIFFSTGAEYELLGNKLRYKKSTCHLLIFHELFHMASTKIGNKIIYTGFSQLDPKNNLAFGFGINEAYTSILDERYFGSKEKQEFYVGVYQISRSITSLLEELVGQENMEKWYSEADLPSLIKCLSRYFGLSSAIRFIDCVDKIAYCNEGYYNPIMSVIWYREAITYLGRAFIKKYAIEFYLNDMPVLDYLDALSIVRNIMDKRIVYPIPFKIIKSRKYTDREFERDVEIIENKLIKKYV